MTMWLWRWGPPIVQMALIFYASSLTAVPSLPGGLTDYLGHFIGYAILATLLLRAFARMKWESVTTRTGAFAWIASVAYSLTDETHQMFVPGRNASVADLVADALGAACAVLVWLAVRWWLVSPAKNRAV